MYVHVQPAGDDANAETNLNAEVVNSREEHHRIIVVVDGIVVVCIVDVFADTERDEGEKHEQGTGLLNAGGASKMDVIVDIRKVRADHEKHKKASEDIENSHPLGSRIYIQCVKKRRK